MLRADNEGQGAAEPSLTKLEEAELLHQCQLLEEEELRAQRVFAALAQDYG